MNGKTKMMLGLASLLAVGQLLGQGARTPEAQLKAAHDKAEFEGDLKVAIEMYKKLADSKDRAVAARALLAMADCYQKLGDAEARKVYERIAKQFSDQKDIAAEANRRFTALGAGQSLSTQTPAQYVGIWNGIADQGGGLESYPVVLTVFGGGVGSTVGTVAYVSSKCGGELMLRSVTPESIELAEKLTYGTQACANNGFVTLRTGANGTLGYRWHYPDARKAFVDRFQIEAKATLSRSARAPEVSVQLGWFDRTGKEISKVGPPDDYRGLELSPDGKRLAVHRHDASGGDIFIITLSTGVTSRLTTDPDGYQDNSSPIWSPDGSRIVFSSYRDNKWGLYVKRADGVGKEELLYESESVKTPMSWSSDGRFIVYWGFHPDTLHDQWALPLTGDRKPFPLLQSDSNERGGQVSPDGKWIVYYGNEDGQGGPYVRPFPSGDGRWKVAANSAQLPRWRADGKELYFLTGAPKRTLMAVDIRVVGSSIEAGVPRPLFDSGISTPDHPEYHKFAVSPDGERFLIPRPVTPAASPR